MNSFAMDFVPGFLNEHHIVKRLTEQSKNALGVFKMHLRNWAWFLFIDILRKIQLHLLGGDSRLLPKEQESFISILGRITGQSKLSLLENTDPETRVKD